MYFSLTMFNFPPETHTTLLHYDIIKCYLRLDRIQGPLCGLLCSVLLTDTVQHLAVTSHNLLNGWFYVVPSY
jgi:hypothetical protein